MLKETNPVRLSEETSDLPYNNYKFFLLHRENVGETIIYQWVEKIRETLLSIKHPETAQKTDKTIEVAKDFSQVSKFFTI